MNEVEQRLFEIKTRLKSIYEAKKKDLGLTQAKIANLLDIKTQGGVSHYMNPNSKQPISKETIIKFASILDIEPSDIDPDISEDFTTLVTKAKEFSEPTATDSIKLTLLDNHLAAGDGVINLDYPDTIRSIEFSRDKFMEIFQRKTANNLSIAIIDGNSMYNPTNAEMSLKHGDIVAIDKTVEGKARIKRLQYLSGYRLKVISDNPSYDPEILEKDQVEQIHFVGKLIKKLTLDIVDL